MIPASISDDTLQTLEPDIVGSIDPPQLLSHMSSVFTTPEKEDILAKKKLYLQCNVFMSILKQKVPANDQAMDTFLEALDKRLFGVLAAKIRKARREWKPAPEPAPVSKPTPQLSQVQKPSAPQEATKEAREDTSGSDADDYDSSESDSEKEQHNKRQKGFYFFFTTFLRKISHES